MICKATMKLIRVDHRFLGINVSFESHWKNKILTRFATDLLQKCTGLMNFIDHKAKPTVSQLQT